MPNNDQVHFIDKGKSKNEANFTINQSLGLRAWPEKMPSHVLHTLEADPSTLSF